MDDGVAKGKSRTERCYGPNKFEAGYEHGDGAF